jgi:hypothetical protein
MIAYPGNLGNPYAFVTGNDGNLYLNYFDNQNWQWRTQGKPLNGALVTDGPSALVTVQSTVQLQTLVRCADGNLHANVWNGFNWVWDPDSFGGATFGAIAGQPAGLAYNDVSYNDFAYNFMHVYVLGADGILHVSAWDRSHWAWDINLPSIQAADDPGVGYYLTNNVPQVHAFVAGASDGALHLSRYNPQDKKYSLFNLGTPPDSRIAQKSTRVVGRPAGISFFEPPENIYVFVAGGDGQLHVWNANAARWDANRPTDLPNNATISGSPAVVSTYFRGVLNLYVFVTGNDGNLYVCVWNKQNWIWKNFGGPPNQQVVSSPSAAACNFPPTLKENLYIFVMGNQGNLSVLAWDSASETWTWRDQTNGQTRLVK